MNNQPKADQSKTGKGLKIIGITIILIAIGATGWFLVARQSQNGTDLIQKNVEVKNKDKQEVVRNEQEQGEQEQGQNKEEGQNKNKEQEKVTENGSKNNQDNNQQNVEELKADEVDTSNWKTYKSAICGIEFKYPPNYFLQIFDENKDACNVFIGKTQFSNPGNNVSLQYITTFTDKKIFLGCDSNVVANYNNTQDKWLIPCDDKNNTVRQNYKQLMNNRCKESNIFLANQKKLLQKNGVHEINVQCETGSEIDAKIIKNVLRSFKFIIKK